MHQEATAFPAAFRPMVLQYIGSSEGNTAVQRGKTAIKRTLSDAV
jgi:hypothetical protein